MSRKGCLITAGVCAALALLLILLVRCVDVAAIGPAGTCIGLSRLNGAVADCIGFRMGWYRVTQALGIASLVVAGLFALWGLCQLIQRKSLRKVDREILLLGGLYAVMLGLYALFEVAVVNYRPVLMPGSEQPEASFPSSHTMLVCVIFGSAMLLSGRYLQNRTLRRAVQALCAAVIAVMVAGRLLSGVHWLTDILGGLLISGALLALFSALLQKQKTTKDETTWKTSSKSKT